MLKYKNKLLITGILLFLIIIILFSSHNNLVKENFRRHRWRQYYTYPWDENYKWYDRTWYYPWRDYWTWKFNYKYY